MRLCRVFCVLSLPLVQYISNVSLVLLCHSVKRKRETSLTLGMLMMKRDRLLQQIWTKKEKYHEANRAKIKAMLATVNKTITTLKSHNMSAPTADKVFSIINTYIVYCVIFFVFVFCRCTRSWTISSANASGPYHLLRFYCTYR